MQQHVIGRKILILFGELSQQNTKERLRIGPSWCKCNEILTIMISSRVTTATKENTEITIKTYVPG